MQYMAFLGGILITMLLSMDSTPQKSGVWHQQAITDEEIMELFSLGDIAVTPQKRWVMALVPDMVYCSIIPTGYDDETRGFIVEIVKRGDDPKYPIMRQAISGTMTNWETDTRGHDPRMESWRKQCLPFIGELPDPDIKHLVLAYFNNQPKRMRK